MCGVISLALLAFLCFLVIVICLYDHLLPVFCTFVDHLAYLFVRAH